MHKLLLLRLKTLQQNYWFWPGTMSLVALLLGVIVPYLDTRIGADWIQAVGFIRPTEVAGARAILTTLAGATLGVAGVAFSVTIVAVSFASANYGPRLIGNFMADRHNQVVLGIFVATFVYCITVLSTVHAGTEFGGNTLDAFVPQLSVLLALLLMLTAVGALIAYIHHIPESINIMNVTASIGDKLNRAIARMMDDEHDRERDDDAGPEVEAWRATPPSGNDQVVRSRTAGFLQQIDIEGLVELAQAQGSQIVLHRAPGDFLVEGEIIASADPTAHGDIADKIHDLYTQGDNRTDTQDVLFLSDQLVEVLGRALSPGVNDPHTATLCLDWLRVGLVAFARRCPSHPAQPGDPVLYRRVTFEDMLDRSFDRMRQYIAADRNATLHALQVLADTAAAALRPSMATACQRQMRRLGDSARELLAESLARDEVEAELARLLQSFAAPRTSRHAG